jgi:hypothetical protein
MGRDSGMWADRVVPQVTRTMMFDAELLHLGTGNLLPFLIGAPNYLSMVSSVRRGLPSQFRLIWLNRRCSTISSIL